MAGTMNSILSFILKPFITLILSRDDDDGIDIVYPLSLFFAFGIWLVYDRYQKMHNSPVPFFITAPLVCVIHLECRPYSISVVIQPADPAWESYPIPNAHLESHLDTDEVMPPMNVPGRRYITSFDPATGLHIGTFLADNEEEIRRKIHRAGVAQQKWRKTNFTQRRRVVRSLQKWLVDNQELCARVACRDSGKTRKLCEAFQTICMD